MELRLVSLFGRLSTLEYTHTSRIDNQPNMLNKSNHEGNQIEAMI